MVFWTVDTLCGADPYGGLVSIIGELASRDEHTEPVMLSLGRSVLIELNFATWVVQNTEV